MTCLAFCGAGYGAGRKVLQDRRVCKNRRIQRVRRMMVVRCSSVTGSPTDPPPVEASVFKKSMQWITTLFPLWSLGAAGVGMLFPGAFLGVKDIYLTLALSGLMLSMGLTLSPEDLLSAAKKWRALVLCFIGCYVVMPLLSVGVTALLQLRKEFTVGMILLGIVSGGQASNLCTYIAKGDTALSVAMTTMTTLSAVFMLPLLSKLLIGQLIPIDAAGVAKSAVQVVLVPIFLGAGINAVAPKVTKSIEPVLPVLGIASTIFIVLISIAKTSASLKVSLLSLLLPVILLHTLGGIFGYLAPKALGLGEITARTLSIETAFKVNHQVFSLPSSLSPPQKPFDPPFPHFP